MVKYNLDKLVRVKANDFCRSTYYTYLPERKFLGFVTQKEGVYCNYFMRDYDGEEIPKGHILKDNVLYEKPEVRMTFVSGIIASKIFETFEEANSFANEITNGRNWLRIK